ncbi:MAG: GNAT family protein [bacterium]|jgi:diamine N-acetyltransferase
MMWQKENISLRAPEPEDVGFLYEMENDHKMWHLSNTLTPFSRFDLEQFVMQSDKDIFATRQARFIIEKEEDGKSLQVGAVDLFDFEPQHKRAGIGIMVMESERNQGIAGIALDLIIDYGFNILGLHQLYGNIESENEVSLRLFKKHGFIIAGLKKEWNRKNGSWADEYLLQLFNPHQV